MSVIDQLFESKLFVLLIFIVGLSAVPLLFLVPIAFGVLIWEAIQTIDNAFWRYYIYVAIALVPIVWFLSKKTRINAYICEKLGIPYYGDE